MEERSSSEGDGGYDCKMFGETTWSLELPVPVKSAGVQKCEEALDMLETADGPSRN